MLAHLLPLAGPPLATQYACTFSSLTHYPFEPPEKFSSKVRWDAAANASYFFGLDGQARNTTTVTRFATVNGTRPTEYIITSFGICETAQPLPMAIADPLGWVRTKAKQVGSHVSYKGVLCSEWFAQDLDSITGHLINKTIWINEKTGAPVGAYKEARRADR